MITFVLFWVNLTSFCFDHRIRCKSHKAKKAIKNIFGKQKPLIVILSGMFGTTIFLIHSKVIKDELNKLLILILLWDYNV
jgi:hypothetical protein